MHRFESDWLPDRALQNYSADQWQPQVLHTATQSLRLASIDFELPLAAIYEGIKLAVRG